MKKMLMGIAITVLGLSLTSPALAGQSGHSRGQKGRHGQGHHQYYRPVPHHHHHRDGLRTGIYISGGFPVYAPAYHGYGPAWGYGPAAVVVAPSPYRVWIPGHYVVRSGARLYMEGYWAPRGQR